MNLKFVVPLLALTTVFAASAAAQTTGAPAPPPQQPAPERQADPTLFPTAGSGSSQGAGEFAP